MKHLERAGKASFRDSFVTKANDIMKDWDCLKEIDGVGLIGVPLSKSSISHSGSFLSPQTIRKCLFSLSTYSVETEYDLANDELIDLGDISMHVTDIIVSHERIEATISAILLQNPQLIPIILGGDHSITAPSVKAFTQAKKGNVGIIQFDAHHDLRNLSDGGPTNGTPFRSLLDAGVIKGENLYQIGIRNFANSLPYTKYGKEHGVHMFTMDEVRKKGIEAILELCLLQLDQNVQFIYVSLDMDVMDQAFAPGCPALGPDGMDVEMLKTGIGLISKHKKVAALDIVEIDPTLDFRDMTSRLAAYMVLTFLCGFQTRE